MWIFDISDHASSFNFTLGRIEPLFKRDSHFAHLYLKEATRLIIRFLSGCPEPKWTKGPIVSRDRHGLPHLLDSKTRSLLCDGGWKSHKLLVQAYLTFLSVFRVFPTKPKVKLSTIVDPFNGAVKTFESSTLVSAVKDLLGNSRLNLKPQQLIKMETASPNGRKSAWGASVDSLAFLFYPKSFIFYAKYQIRHGSLSFLLWLTAILYLIWPLVLLYRVLGLIKVIELGRLSVVYDQAGKARVIGITNYWLQLALKPLHDAIFRLLRQIDCDATFDQTKKLKELVKSGKKFHCFDLSAATDRLPLILQRDILNILRKNLGNDWESLLDFRWFFKGSYYKYAVGQPMGAYSSWAMLALTHHVIVRIAALKVGIKRFTDYSVLGDDIIICNDDVAAAYLSLMDLLGVSINLSKSVVSSEICEFAKRWWGPDYDLSPVGPGLILRYIRSSWYIGALLNMCVNLKIINDFPKLLIMIKGIPKKDILLSLWSTIGLGSDWVKMYGDVQNTITYALSSCSHPDEFRYCLYEAVSLLRLEQWRDSKLKLERDMDFFYRNWYKIFSSSSWPLWTIEFILKLIGPGFWCYGLSYERAMKSYETFPKPGDGSWDCIKSLVSEVESINTSSIDWTQKRKIKSSKEKIKKLNDVFERTRSETFSLFHPGEIY